MAENPTHVTLPDPARPGGRRAWRSLEELADTAAFRDRHHREFPRAASEWDDGFSRRHFLKLMGASLALAGVSAGCHRKRDEKIFPHVQQPEQLVPGRPRSTPCTRRAARRNWTNTSPPKPATTRANRLPSPARCGCSCSSTS